MVFCVLIGDLVDKSAVELKLVWSNSLQPNEKSFSLKTMEDGQVLLYLVS